MRMRTPAHFAICLFLSNLSPNWRGRYWSAQIDDISLWPSGYDRLIKAKNLSIGIVIYKMFFYKRLDDIDIHITQSRT